MRRTFRLRSGRVCRLDDPGLPFLPNYHVFYFPASQGKPTQCEMEEMLTLAFRSAQELGEAEFNDPECYSVLFNGARARRRAWVHFHLLPVQSVNKKRWALTWLLLKRWTRLVRKTLDSAERLRPSVAS